MKTIAFFAGTLVAGFVVGVIVSPETIKLSNRVKKSVRNETHKLKTKFTDFMDKTFSKDHSLKEEAA
jgi:archaellum component FlaG (FlaF/FlaG flagellin family)